MSFKRHHQPSEPVKPPVTIIKAEPAIEVPKIEIQPVETKEPEPVVEPVKEPAPIIIAPVVKETIKKLHPKKRKKRADKKEFTNLGLVGDTVIARDFRAIVKKAGQQINTVLSEILHKWNTENYNL